MRSQKIITLVNFYSLAKESFLIILGSLLVALLAQIRIALPFTPVPITGQTFGVILVGALLKSKKAALSLFIYLIEGILGFPVFASFKGGLTYFLGPTGGYLIGFIFSAYITGYLIEKMKNRNTKNYFLALTFGNFSIYPFGLLWLSFFVGIKKVLFLGFYPFILGDFIKILIALNILLFRDFLRSDSRNR